MGGMMAAFGEGLAVGAKCGLEGEQILDVLASGAIDNPMFTGKGSLVLEDNYSPAFPLKHMHKDLRLAVELGDKNCQRHGNNNGSGGTQGYVECRHPIRRCLSTVFARQGD
jgi:3-hydroxyisobutyrate dehydrogenase-like beta-hydroxyacid dehydrogenase